MSFIHQCGVQRVTNLTFCPNLTEPVGKEVLHETQFELIAELYLISGLCLLGLFGNVVSIVVLRKDRERREPLFLLQMLALADAFYIAVALFRYPLKYLLPDQEMYMDMQVYIFPLLKTAQAITIWIMVLVTIDRYIYVCVPLRARQVFSKRGRRMISCLIFVVGFLYNLPRFFDSCVMKFHDACTGRTIARMVYAPQLNNTLYFDIYQNALYIIFLYVAPLSILLALNCKLIGAIKYSKRRHREITVTGGYQNCIGYSSSSYLPGTSSSRHVNQHHENNATLVLIIIVLVFIICETPELIYRCIGVIVRHVENMENTFSREFRHTFSTVSELLMVINSSVNFFIYCAFGRRFRRVMRYTFTPNGSTLITHETVPLQQQLQLQQG